MTLTREQILGLPAGRELDALVAGRVMGWKRNEYDAKAWFTLPGSVKRLPRFSADIAAAWRVVERLRGAVRLVKRDAPIPPGEDAFGYCVTVGGRAAYAPSAPLAICRAALLAVAAEHPPGA